MGSGRAWHLGLGMHLFRQFERESEFQVVKCASGRKLNVKKPTPPVRTLWRKREQAQFVKNCSVAFLELPFCVLRGVWSPRRPGWRLPLTEVSHPAKPAKVENPSSYRGLGVRSTQGIAPMWNKRLRSTLYALERQGSAEVNYKLGFPNGTIVRSQSELFASLPQKAFVRDWFVSAPSTNCSRSQKRSLWWLTKAVKKAPKELRVGLVRKDDQKITRIRQKLQDRSRLKGKLGKSKIQQSLRKRKMRLSGAMAKRGIRIRKLAQQHSRPPD